MGWIHGREFVLQKAIMHCFGYSLMLLTVYLSVAETNQRDEFPRGRQGGGTHLQPEDLRSLTPLLWEHVTPYGGQARFW